MDLISRNEKNDRRKRRKRTPARIGRATQTPVQCPKLSVHEARIQTEIANDGDPTSSRLLLAC